MLRIFLAAILTPSVVLGKGFPWIPPTSGRPWPLPQNEEPGNGSMVISVGDFSFTAVGIDCDILQTAFERYTNIIFSSMPTTFLSNKHSRSLSTAEPLTTLEVNVMTECEDLPHMYMDEQYELRICAPDEPTEATLISQSIWGALRGLETFSQLAVAVNSSTLIINCTQILDYPRFSHRGVMLDTARHFLPLSKILENLDLMAMNKFNVFHWHIVDDESFPYQSGVYPDLSAMGAWSDIHIFSPEDMTTVIEYARYLGIRVIPEFDTPGHTRSWGEGQPGLLTPCYNNGTLDGEFGPIDPSKEENFDFLTTLFTEVTSRYPDHYFHVGGDEVDFGCWQSSPEITDFMESLNITGDYEKLEEYYTTRLLDIVSNLPTENGYIIWEDVFDNGVEIADDTIVQVWKYENDPSQYYPEIASVTEAGYNALLSSCWYLNIISYGADWHKFYDCDPQGFTGTTEQKNLVLGGEACMWGEYVDATNVIPRTWPRAAPVAERLWSSPNDTTSADEAAPRLEEHRCRLRRRGYDVEPFGPSFCEGVL